MARWITSKRRATSASETPPTPLLCQALTQPSEGRGPPRAPTDTLVPRTAMSPVVPSQRWRRRRNSNPHNDFRLLSPNTRFATQGPTRRNSPRRSPLRCRQSRLRARRPTKQSWPPWPTWPTWPTRQNQSFFHSPRRASAKNRPQIPSRPPICRRSTQGVAGHLTPNSQHTNNFRFLSPRTLLATQFAARQ
jgi:hypothetical protein